MKKCLGLISLVIVLVSSALACHAGNTRPLGPTHHANMQISSPELAADQLIPAQFACGGADISPTLRWTRPPAGTQSQVLILSDPDAPGGTFTHWILYNLPATATRIAAHIAQTTQLPDGSMQARNDANTIGYFGPCPPSHATHRYIFRIYALNTKLPLAPGASKAEVLEAMQGHVLAQGELMARYHR